MRVLVLAPSACTPANTGARLRTYHLARQLSRYARVVFLSFSDDPRDASSCVPAPDVPFEVAESPERGTGYRCRDIVLGALGRSPFTVLNWTRPAMGLALDRLLATNQFDIVQVESIQMAGYLKHLCAAPGRPTLVCDWHNIESEILHRYAQTAGVFRSQYARLTASRLVRFERQVMPQFDAHLAVSARDCEQLRRLSSHAPIFEVPNGVDIDFYSTTAAAVDEPTTSPDGGRRRVVFIGSMDYHANVEAACQFARCAWPLVYRRLPHLRFTIVGRRPAPAVTALASIPGVEVTGEVPDVRPHLMEALALVVPLRSGGGTRLKILEAMAAQVPVVSTPIGAEGLLVQDGTDIILASSDGDFVGALSALHDNPSLRVRLTANARSLIESKYDWSRIGQDLWEVYQLIREARSERQSGPGLVGSRG